MYICVYIYNMFIYRYVHIYIQNMSNLHMCRSRARAAEAGGPSMMLPVGFEQPSLDAGKHAITNCQCTACLPACLPA